MMASLRIAAALRPRTVRALSRPMRPLATRPLPDEMEPQTLKIALGALPVTQDLSVLGMSLGAVYAFVRHGAPTFEALRETPSDASVDRAAFLELMSNELTMRGHAGDLSELDAWLRTRAPEELSAETLGEVLDGLRGAVSNL